MFGHFFLLSTRLPALSVKLGWQIGSYFGFAEFNVINTFFRRFLAGK
jgi:hypothetical protein